VTSALFFLGVAAIVGGVAAWSVPTAAIVAGVALVTLAVLLERGAAEPDATADAARAHPERTSTS